MPNDISAAIIDNVLNGPDVYGSGHRLARAMSTRASYYHTPNLQAMFRHTAVPQ